MSDAFLIQIYIFYGIGRNVGAFIMPVFRRR
nr:MAG TPA: hypothetical protein [Caudoviricetes sp.]